MAKYRKIYEKYHGKIPVDDNGVSYDIHHLDGNRNNNDINNLVAVSVKEHYEIHKSQKDWFACQLIAQRFNIEQNELISIKNNYKGENHPCKKEEIKEKIRNSLRGRKNDAHSKYMKNRMTSDLNPMKNPDVAKKVGEKKKSVKRPEISGENHHFFGKGHLMKGDKNGRSVKITKFDMLGNILDTYSTMIEAYTKNNISVKYVSFTKKCKKETPINGHVYKKQ